MAGRRRRVGSRTDRSAPARPRGGAARGDSCGWQPARLRTASVVLAVFSSAAGDASPQIDPAVSRAVSRGLEYLARTQEENGAWLGDVGSKRRESYLRVQLDVPHVGVSALAGIAFLAGGHLPERGPHGETASRVLEFVLDSVNEFGFAGSHSTRMYSHAYATLFLAEAYGMTLREELASALTEAVDFIVSTQNGDGSWRYQPFAWDSDMSICVCQLMALRAARGAGIHVPAKTIDRAVEYVQDSLVSDARDAWFRRDPMGYYHTGVGAFQYQYYGDTRSSFALTAAGVTSMYHASRYDPPQLRDSLAFLEESQRMVTGRWQGHFFYWYGHYYASQAMFLTGRYDGHDWWQGYWDRISRELLRSQQEDGRWLNPDGPGDVFGTAIACIVLQTPNQYLPILQR